jgi:hypothetical protein
MSEELFFLLFWGVPLVAGCFAWSRGSRKTACGVWGMSVFLTVAMVAPSSCKAKPTARRNACIANLKQMEGAVQQWAQDEGKQATNTYTFSDPALLSYLKGSTLPACPGGGHYSPGATVADAPKCSLAAIGHTL